MGGDGGKGAWAARVAEALASTVEALAKMVQALLGQSLAWLVRELQTDWGRINVFGLTVVLIGLLFLIVFNRATAIGYQLDFLLLVGCFLWCALAMRDYERATGGRRRGKRKR